MIVDRSGDILIFNDICDDVDIIKQSAIDEYNYHKHSLPDYHTGYRITLSEDMLVTAELDKKLEPCLDEYIKQYGLPKSETYSFSDWIIMGWTVPGFGMDIHNDHTNDVTVTGEKLQQPYLTAIFYLAHNCEGGELEFPDINFTLEAKTGTLIIFPSEFNHQVSPYLNGERVVAQKFIFMGNGDSK